MSNTFHRHAFVICCFGLLTIAGCWQPPSLNLAARSEVLSLLPADGATMDVMGLQPSPRHDQLVRKFEDARVNHPEWFRDHVQKRKAGQPLPYDPKLGMSQAEYEELLDLGGKLKYVKMKTATLQVRQEGSLVRFDGGTDLLHLTPVKLNLDTDSVTTPFGTAATRSRIAASEGQAATGPWDGVLWKLVEGSPDGGQGTAIQFGLGKLKETGRGILYYDVKKTDGAMKNRVSYALQYDLQATP